MRMGGESYSGKDSGNAGQWSVEGIKNFERYKAWSAALMQSVEDVIEAMETQGVSSPERLVNVPLPPTVDLKRAKRRYFMPTFLCVAAKYQ